MRRIVKVFILFSVTFCSCLNAKFDNANTSNADNNQLRLEKQTSVTANEALSLAKEFSHLDYDLNKYQTFVENKADNIWEVRFVRKERLPKDFCCGGYDFSVFVSKQNGEIINATNGK